ncbi:MAG: FAD-binding oxidoreductase [Acidobacteriaceae bacterium]|nr:FAD-binding oxidoreductase [Acidobacteriaceae bacterium]MBV9033723.1 FAD-binding oxidoreductase [Acidobacteriaceae bacterium]MBV9224015.1 FAD-binding oxidoreductase [Acidobacteriaceae bacterium]MBV9305551.1 FAD-binding oxidoreductase [Acidobacteriaceae bacterium]
MQNDTVARFRAQLRGELITPNDPTYAVARKVHNGTIDRKPALIAKCADVADVQASVRFARENRLRVSIRGGGHNAGGLGVCDDGLVIDLSPIRYVHVNPAERVVRTGGGSLWGDVDHATHAFGLAVPSGIISTTGVGGLTLGGGLGHLTRKYGLTIDNLLSADMVLANGTFLVASPDENSDLFWAIRGGGGNFGVVTSFEFQAHPVHTVCAGPMLWHIEEAADVMKWYREFIVSAPEDVSGFFAFLTVPPGPPFPESLHMKKMCGIIWCCTGSIDNANEILEPIRSYRPPSFEFFGPMPFPMLQSMFDGLYPPGLQMYWKADFFRDLSDQAIDLHVHYGSQVPTLQSTMHLYPINGAAHKPASSDTPWGHRDALWSGVMVGVDPDPANRDLITNWSREYWQALHSFGAGGAYINFMMEEGPDRIRAAYGGNFARLAAIKAKYDSENFFNVNQNIRPAA